ncbi:MAG TPA: glycosyltransferase family 1 protein [Planctomycetes bacterium]|nr:glycosyltransferase family 1 protein [Planctomycetota bacterium]
MRILYHHRTQAEDGQAVHVRALLGAFERAGHAVFESGLVKHGAGASPEHGAEPSPPDSKGRRRWGWVTRLPRFARELAEYGYNTVARQRLLTDGRHFEPDFLYERYAFANAAGTMVAPRLGVPLVLEVNSPMVLELERTRGLSFPRIARRLEDWIFCSADAVCCVTEVLAGMLVDLGVERDRVLVTPNGVDLDAYRQTFAEGARAKARVRLGLPPEAEGEVVIGFVGYYRDWHRLDVVLQAMAEPGLEAARLVLVGEGPARESLEREADRLALADRVHFAGRRPHAEIPALLAAFDQAVVPAINEYASPLKLHEYMAAGLATIAPDQPNLREVLRNEHDALLVPPGDADAMAAAVLRLARDGGLRTRLGERARSTVVERDLTWDGNARRVVERVERLRAAGGGA